MAYEKDLITVYVDAESGEGSLPIKMLPGSLERLGAKSGDELVWLVKNGKTTVKRREKAK